MAVIKCSNCENEILDTEIVCPYCDCPVSVTKEKMKKAMENAPDPMDGATVKIATDKDFAKEKEAMIKNSQKRIKDAKKAYPPKAKKEQEKENSESKDDSVKPEGNKAPEKPTAPKAPEKAPEKTQETPSEDSSKDKRDTLFDDAQKSDGEDDNALNNAIAHSEAIQKSFEERRKARIESAEYKKKMRRKKNIAIAKSATVLIITLVGIFFIVKIIGSITDNYKNEKAFKEKVNKKGGETQTESAGFKGKGFVYGQSGTTTLLINEDIAFEDIADENSPKPWAEFEGEIEHITIGNEVTKIADYAFKDLRKLKDVTIGKEVTEIGDYAFAGCDSLTKIKFNLDESKSNLEEIGDYAFDGCSSIKELKLGSKVTKIGEGAFRDCTDLETVKFTGDEVEILDNAFYGIDDLIVICEEDSDAELYCMKNNIKYMSEEKFKNRDDEDSEEEDDDEVTTSKPSSSTSEKDNKPSTPNNNTQQKPQSKPSAESKPQTNAKPESKPSTEQKPAQKPQEETKPQEKPQEQSKPQNGGTTPTPQEKPATPPPAQPPKEPEKKPDLGDLSGELGSSQNKEEILGQIGDNWE